MKMIIGLGNPDKDYDNTRHNIGFMAIDNYLGKVEWKNKFNSLYYITEKNSEKIIFIKPQTYMNLSGEAVIQFLNYYKCNIDDILVIHDDLDLSLGYYKLKKNSSSGGHNGIKSLIAHLHTESFNRLKLGISNNKEVETKNYVLGKFTSLEKESISDLFKITNEIIDFFLANDIEKTMQKFNYKKGN